jgi:hypothetical protein
MRVLVGAIILFLLSTGANAQPSKANSDSFDQFFEPALKDLGVYATAPVRESYRRAAAAEFAKGATQAGFQDFEVKSFSNGMVTGEIKISSGGKAGTITTGNAAVRVGEDPTKANYLLSFRSAKSVGTYLERYSTIKLIVRPAPPRDYNVLVNDERCPATEEGIYKVMPGISKVNVSRAQKPRCDWQGTIEAGAIQMVECKL